MGDKNIIKFKGKLSTRLPQMFPKNNQKYQDGDFAILNMELVEILEGDVELNQYGNITIQGNLPYIRDFNKTYIVLAEVQPDPKFKIKNVVLMLNEDISFDNIDQQKLFLEEILTTTQIQNLYSTLQDPMKTIMEHDVKSLCNVHGIGEKTATRIIEKYEENKDYSEAFVELACYDLSINQIKKLSNQYGSPQTLINKIKENPYILASEVDGIGFKTADELALNNGLPRLSQTRLRSFIEYILAEAAQNGYSWISSEVLIDKILNDLDSDFPMEEIVQAVIYLKENRILWDGEKGKVALQRYYDLERKIAEELIRIRDAKCELVFDGWEDRVKQAEILQGWPYTEEQRKAIEDTLKYQINIIAGLAGTGKSSTALGAVKALGEISFAQAALAGKAAARIQEITGYEAYTIYRLLGFNPMNYDGEESSSFTYNKNNPLYLDVILLDEFPMIGGNLFLSVLQAIPSGCKLILLGDDGQLPAIGALNIGSDLMNSLQISMNMLTEIHRQAKRSAIITESIKVRHGEQIVEKGWVGREIRGELQDLELDIYDDKKLTADKCIEHFKEKLQMSNNDIMEVQLIVPKALDGDSSVYVLNNLIQTIYNPPSSTKSEVYLLLKKSKKKKNENEKGYNLRVGDKIINMKNNYKIPLVEKGMWGWEVSCNECNNPITTAIFNGYIGEIIDITNNNLIIYFHLIKQTVMISPNHWKTEKGIHLGYALTIHKMQGSSVKYPICAIDYSSYIMLNRELVYTAMTRASKYCTLVAENKALRYAISRSSTEIKQTFLKEILEQIDSKKEVA